MTITYKFPDVIANTAKEFNIYWKLYGLNDDLFSFSVLFNRFYTVRSDLKPLLEADTHEWLISSELN